MSELLPIIEQLAAARGDAERADWLAACPLAILLGYQETIRNRLDHAGFAAGLDYLDTVLSATRAVRRDCGRRLFRTLIDAEGRMRLSLRREAL